MFTVSVAGLQWCYCARVRVAGYSGVTVLQSVWLGYSGVTVLQSVWVGYSGVTVLQSVWVGYSGVTVYTFSVAGLQWEGVGIHPDSPHIWCVVMCYPSLL